MRKLPLIALVALFIPLSGALKKVNIEASDVTYDIHPIVHNIEYGDEMISIPHKIQLNVSNIDEYTKQEAYEVLALKGVLASTKKDYSDFELNISTYNSSRSDEHFEKLDAYTLDIDNDGITIVGKDTTACFYALQSLREIFNQSNNSVRELSIKDYSNSYYRGVIEGLYGVPYNNFEIMDMIEFLSYYKANSFFYGPRHDSYFRTAWRDLLPEDELTMLKQISDYAKSRKVNFYFGLNPVETDSFVMENYEKDYKVFIARFEQAYSVGVRNFFISADDVVGETIERDLHLRFMNDLAAWVKEKGDCGRILLTPSCYCGFSENRSEITTEYLSTFKGQLDESIDIFWTGDLITSCISNGDYEYFTENTGRKPVYWLNWPVNDYAPTKLIMSKAEMLDVTYEDEDAPFLGLISNPQILPYVSYPAIYQCLDYAWNYRDYDVNAVYYSAFERIESKEPEALERLCSYLANANKYIGDTYFEESPVLKVLINQYKSLKKQNLPVNEIKEYIYEELNTTIEAVQILIDSAENRNIVKELMPFILAVKDTCEATIKYLELEDLIAKGNADEVRIGLEEANKAYEEIKENRVIVLEYVSCNEEYASVDVCNAVLTPFLNELIAEFDYEARLITGLPTGTIYRGLSKIYQGSLEDTTDKNDYTFAMFEGYPSTGAFIQFDLEEVTEITSLKVLYRDPHEAACYFPEIYISNDGKDFELLTNVYSNKTILDLRDEPIYARFIRLGNMNGGDLPWWVSLAEFDYNFISDDEIKVTTSGINGIYSGDVKNIFDGDTSTYCWFNDHPEKDAYILVDYRSVQTANNINVIFKDGNNGVAFMHCLEYSLDGVTFYELGEATSNGLFIDLEGNPIEFRYLRFSNNTGDRLGWWTSIAEISLNVVAPTKVTYEGFEGIYSGTVDELFDYNDESYLWFASGAENNGYVLIEYNEEVTASNFRVLFFNGSKAENQPGLTNCYLSTLEVSLNGVDWITIETGNDDNTINVSLDEEITFKYIRISNTEGYTTPHWVAIASVEVG